jgi:hypothetical protein
MAKYNPDEIAVKKLYISNTLKTLKYYFKNIFYILSANAFAIFIFETPLIRINYRTYIFGITGNTILYNGFSLFSLIYYGTLIALLTIPKVTLYGNTINVMKKKGSAKNDIINLFVLCCSRFLGVLETMLIYFILIIILTACGILPGIIFAFYWYFGIFLSAVGDMNNKIPTSKTGDINVPTGIKALDRSKKLVATNLIRFMLSTIAIFLIIFIVNYIVKRAILYFNFKTGRLLTNYIRLCIWDIFYIYSAYLFSRFQLLEREAIKEVEDVQKKDSDSMKKAMVNKFKGTAKK